MTAHWFRPKRYGYGATPVTWEGWAATLAAIIVIAGSILAMNLFADRSNALGWLVWAAVVAVVTLWFVRFSRRHTDGEWRWRWGKNG
jgi:Na+/melibiose symporter-like transporter